MKIPLRKNTITNYIGMFVRLVQGLLVTRWLIADLGPEHYGLWGMLWSFFCYSLLLDFGLGVAAQKATATELWRKDIALYNRTIATVFSINLFMSVVILAGTGVAMFFVRQLFHLEEGVDPSYYRNALLCSGIGAAIVFPLGVFTEMLVGLQKIYLRNYITIASKVLELALVLSVFALGGGLIILLCSTLGLMFLTQMVLFVVVRNSIPGFRLGFLPDRSVFKEIFHFSGAIYLVSLAKMVWERGTTLMISMFSGLPPVSVYSIGVGLPVKMMQFATPYQENITPMSALLFARKKYRYLGQILLNSLRWNSFLAAGMTVGVIIFARPLLRFLFKVDSPEITWICQFSALSVYCWLVLRNIPEKYLIMANRHKFLSIIFILDSAIFVVSTVTVFMLWDVNGAYTVMYTSIGSRLFCTVFFMMPCFLQSTKLGTGTVLNETLLKPFLFSLPAIAAGTAEFYYMEGRYSDMVLLLTAGFTCGPLYLVSFYIFGLKHNEKKRFMDKLTQKWSQK